MPAIIEVVDHIFIRLQNIVIFIFPDQFPLQLPEDLRAGVHASPVAQQSMPNAHLSQTVLFLCLSYSVGQAMGKFHNIGGIGVELAGSIVCIRPTVINQHPVDRDLLGTQLIKFTEDICLVDLVIEGIPGAPAKMAEHFRKNLVLTENMATTLVLRNSSHQVMDQRIGIGPLTKGSHDTCPLQGAAIGGELHQDTALSSGEISAETTIAHGQQRRKHLVLLP